MWNKLLHENAQREIARGKLFDKEMEQYRLRWPDWNEREIENARDLFLSFDVNNDGVIDFSEL